MHLLFFKVLIQSNGKLTYQNEFIEDSQRLTEGYIEANDVTEKSILKSSEVKLFLFPH